VHGDDENALVGLVDKDGSHPLLSAVVDYFDLAGI
jgi:hypothetical protein